MATNISSDFFSLSLFPGLMNKIFIPCLWYRFMCEMEKQKNLFQVHIRLIVLKITLKEPPVHFWFASFGTFLLSPL